MDSSTTKTEYPIHPAAELFPLMTEEEYQGLKADISKNGQEDVIVLWNGQLIDGRNRLRACLELQREPSIGELDSDQDPWVYVISHNLHRRHLTTGQRAMIAEELAKLKHGGDRKSEEIKVQKKTLSLKTAAKQLKVSRASSAKARNVRKYCSDEVRQAVKDGTLSLDLAEKLGRKVFHLPTQTELLAKGVDAVRDAIKSPLKAATLCSETPSTGGLNEIERGQLCQTTIESLYEATGGLKSFPGLLKKIILYKAWERRVVKGKFVELSSLKELITSKPIAGWGVDLSTVEMLLRDDQEALSMFKRAIGSDNPGVRIDSGPMEASDRFRDVPKTKWRALASMKRDYIATKTSFDCRCLVEFCAEAELAWESLGYASAEDMIRRGYELDPAQINAALTWLESAAPEYAISPPPVLRSLCAPSVTSVTTNKHGASITVDVRFEATPVEEWPEDQRASLVNRLITYVDRELTTDVERALYFVDLAERHEMWRFLGKSSLQELFDWCDITVEAIEQYRQAVKLLRVRRPRTEGADQ